MLILGLQKTTLLDYPGKVATTLFTGGCNFRCPYCHNKDLVVNPSQMDAFSIDDIMDHLRNKRKVLDCVCITGGEPTLQPDLYDFIVQIKELGLLVKLDTNGTNPDILGRLISNGLLDYVAMDIKHSRERYNDVACQTHFDLAAIDASTKLILNSQIDYEFRTTCIKELHSSEDFHSIGEWLNDAKAYFLQCYRESENVINPIFSAPTRADLEAFQDICKLYIPNTQIRGVD